MKTKYKLERESAFVIGNRMLLLALVIIFSTVTLSIDANAGDSLHFSIYTNGKKYCKKFPLDERIDSVRLVSSLGVPTRQMVLGGQELWAYEIGEFAGLRQYTYVIVDGIVIDVQFTHGRSQHSAKALQGVD